LIIFGIISKSPASHIPRRIPALNRQPRPSNSSKFIDVEFDSIIDVELDTRDDENAKLGSKIESKFGFKLCKLLSINCFDLILTFKTQESESRLELRFHYSRRRLDETHKSGKSLQSYCHESQH
jgi:hypothetical protein